MITVKEVAAMPLEKALHAMLEMPVASFDESVLRSDQLKIIQTIECIKSCHYSDAVRVWYNKLDINGGLRQALTRLTWKHGSGRSKKTLRERMEELEQVLLTYNEYLRN